MAELNQRVKINGEEYELKGNVDFSNLTINKIGTNVPDSGGTTSRPNES